MTQAFGFGREGLRQAAGVASQEAQAATGFLNPNTGQSAESS